MRYVGFVAAICFAAAAIAALAASDARGAFPGANGKIGYLNDPRFNSFELWTVSDGDGSDAAMIYSNTEATTCCLAASPLGPVWALVVPQVSQPSPPKIRLVPGDYLSNDEIGLVPGIDTSPAFFPNGARLAYLHTDPSNPGQNGVWVMNVDGTQRHRISPVVASGLSVSPDGSKIAMSGLAIMNADGSNLLNLGVSGNDPDWAPNGSKLVYESGGAIWVFDAGGPQQLTTPVSPTDSKPSFSPDGTRIAFIRCCEPTFDRVDHEVYVMNAEGTGLRQLTVTHGPPPFIVPFNAPGPFDTAWAPASEPTAVTLARFSATRRASRVHVRWRTASERNLVGFNVYRERGGRRIKVNRTLIASVFGGTPTGHAYSLVDRSRTGTLRYRLQAVHLDGSRHWLAAAVLRAS